MSTDGHSTRSESRLADHRRQKKILKPPLADLDFTLSSWINVRMPEMLWAALLHHGLGRAPALQMFRHVANFVAMNRDVHDVTLSALARLPAVRRTQFIQHILSGHREAAHALRPLVLFAEVPGFAEWKAELGDPPIEDGQPLAEAVNHVLWHQSEEATDCRWVKVLCRIASGKMRFVSTMAATAREIVEYPNRGDLRRVRPSIRAAEIGSTEPEETDFAWPKAFWKMCFDSTPCIPQSSVERDIYEDEAEWEKRREYYRLETERLHTSLIKHTLTTATTSGVDARHDTACGFAFYAFNLFTEITLYQLDHTVSGRLALRTLAECVILFSYLVRKNEPKLWDGYRSYGAGQAKLVYLKMQELSLQAGHVDMRMLEQTANEDMSQEFVPINLGNWDGADLRKMSEDAGVKDVYDQYYGSTSSYSHANWAALREVGFEVCRNPLHRYHRLPLLRLPYLKSVTEDARGLANRVFGLLGDLYPGFEDRIGECQRGERAHATGVE